MHSTNYYNTFIEIAEDCPVSIAEIPPRKGEKPTVANIQFDLLHEHPYQLTSDEVLFRVFSIRNSISDEAMEAEMKKFFSKGQPCFRSSPLTKRYGWGVHSNAEGKIAIISIESEAYVKLKNDKTLKVLKAMRSKKA